MSQFAVGDKVKINIPNDYTELAPKPFYVDSIIADYNGEIVEPIDPDDEYPLMSYDVKFVDIKMGPPPFTSYQQVVPEFWMSLA